MADKPTPTTAPIADIEQEVVQEARPILETLLKYKTPIIAGVATLLVMVAAYSGYTGWRNYSLTSAQEELGEIITTTSGQDLIDQLTAFADTTDSRVRPAALFELADALMESSLYAEAADVWTSLAEIDDEHIQGVAILGQARCLLLDGRAQAAFDTAKAYQVTAPEAFSLPVNRLLAAAAEQTGDKAAALEAYQALAASQQVQDLPFIESRIRELSANE